MKKILMFMLILSVLSLDCYAGCKIKKVQAQSTVTLQAPMAVNQPYYLVQPTYPKKIFKMKLKKGC